MPRREGNINFLNRLDVNISSRRIGVLDASLTTKTSREGFQGWARLNKSLLSTNILFKQWTNVVEQHFWGLHGFYKSLDVYYFHKFQISLKDEFDVNSRPQCVIDQTKRQIIESASKTFSRLILTLWEQNLIGWFDCPDMSADPCFAFLPFLGGRSSSSFFFDAIKSSPCEYPSFINRVINRVECLCFWAIPALTVGNLIKCSVPPPPLARSHQWSKICFHNGQLVPLPILLV